MADRSHSEGIVVVTNSAAVEAWAPPNCLIEPRLNVYDCAAYTKPQRSSAMSPEAKGKDPSVIVVMGVSGSGKSTIAAMLAARLGWTYEDADWFHPPSNVKKMHSGVALTDDDRRPWLHGIAAWIDATRNIGAHGVIACSALKRAYREILVGDRRDVRIVYLKGGRELIARRMALRHGHFMPGSMLDSQFATLQEPGEDECPIVVSIEPRPHEIVDAIVAKLGISTEGIKTKAAAK